MVHDVHSRPLRSLRLSVTDRCNLRCSYCMPEEEYLWLQRDHLLTFEEIVGVVRAFQQVGVERLRLTGGEPLLRRELPSLVAMLAGLGLQELAMTTNGLLLGKFAAPLKAAGLQRLTVSLDTLNPQTFERLARRRELPAVLEGIEAARAAGFVGIKLDTVLIRGVNDHELLPLVEWAGTQGLEIRFIEYMDVAGATRWQRQEVVSQGEILRELEGAFGTLEPLTDRGSAPAQRFRLSHGQVVGVIASVTQPFCRDCDRCRLTSDGQMLRCLYAREGLDLRARLRGQASPAELSEVIAAYWSQRRDRGAEERAALGHRSSFVSLEELRREPRLEMHTRGG